ncbi:L,D-transpeptidase [soil metagenome]
MLRLFVILLAISPALFAQERGYDQELVGELLERQGTGPLPSEPVVYERYTLAHPTNNSILARHALYQEIGEGDVRLGRDRLRLAVLLNGRVVTQLRTGDYLVLPGRASDFDLDTMAFSPFPMEYAGAAEIDKLVLLDKDVQAWAAYEYGQLVRWGLASTGSEGTPTPTGRFTMNWRELDRISSESPPGEEGHMRYVMNIHAARGIHLHQYDTVPSGPPVGAGCVRLVTADAQWLWDWSDPWVTTAGPGAIGGRVLEQGTLVLVQGREPEGTPHRFVEGPNGIERVVVSLPEDPMAVPRGDR